MMLMCGVQVHISGVGAIVRLEGIAVHEDRLGKFLTEGVFGELNQGSVGQRTIGEEGIATLDCDAKG